MNILVCENERCIYNNCGKCINEANIEKYKTSFYVSLTDCKEEEYEEDDYFDLDYYDYNYGDEYSEDESTEED